MTDLTGKVSKIGEHPVGGGGYGDVWKGVLGNRWVAIKVVRTYVESDSGEAIKLVNQEIKAWSRLEHDNILPLAGVCYDFGFAPALVSIWMENGTANHYLKEHPEADYLALLSGIAAGLLYLHQANVIHGDLKGDNVLIAPNGVPCLSDFGLSKSLLSSGLLASTATVKGTWRWMARELADYKVELAWPDEKSDVWAFGMMALELGTGHHPYYDLKEVAALHSIATGLLPNVPVGPTVRAEFTPFVMAICKQCWKYPPVLRPKMEEVAKLLQREGKPNLTSQSVRRQVGSRPKEASNASTPLHWAASHGDLAMATSACADASNINVPDDSGHTPLYVAADRGHLSIVELLLVRQAEVNSSLHQPHNPLHAAATHGHFSIVRCLLDSGATVGAADDEGKSALLIAAAGGHRPIVDLLLDRGAAVNVADNSGRSALLLATDSGHFPVVETLLEHGADPNIGTPQSRALHLAVKRNQDALVEVLLKYGAHSDGTDRSGCTPICLAARNGREKTVALLLGRGADLKTPDLEGRTPLAWAARGKYKSVVVQLLQAGGDPNAPDQKGRTPLSWAVANNDFEAAQILLEHGANPDTIVFATS